MPFDIHLKEVTEEVEEDRKKLIRRDTNLISWIRIHGWMMLSFILLILLITLLPILIKDQKCNSNDDSYSFDENVAWLKSHSASINALNMADNDSFEDLHSLSFLASKKVVFLGEAQHGDATPDGLRGRIIQYMHEELDFNTLAWETGPCDAQRITKQLQNLTEITASSVYEIFAYNMGASAYWAHADQTQPIFNYIANTLITGNPLEIVGTV